MLLLLGSIFIIFAFFNSILNCLSITWDVTLSAIKKRPKFYIEFFTFSLITALIDGLITGAIAIDIPLSGLLGGIIYLIFLLMKDY